jgi:hypothetical protein
LSDLLQADRFHADGLQTLVCARHGAGRDFEGEDELLADAFGFAGPKAVFLPAQKADGTAGDNNDSGGSGKPAGQELRAARLDAAKDASGKLRRGVDAAECVSQLLI